MTDRHISLVRVKNNDTWPLFCPLQAQPLLECPRENFNQLLMAHEILNIGTVCNARSLWETLIEEVVKGRGPSVMFQDAVNREKHLFTSTYQIIPTIPL